MKCPKCQHENPEDSTFCGKCATRLGKEVRPSFTKTLETSQEELTSGTKLSGRYQIIEELGHGGMGKVYRAEDTSLSRHVAIKVLPEEFASDPERLARFEREAKLLAVLNHPNIASIHGIEESEGRRFLILELADGETLRQRLDRGPLPVDEALETCKQIAEGFEAAHEKGIIHRDLKPGNIMISAEGKVKILDFGLARAYAAETTDIDIEKSPTITAQMTKPGVIMGTAAYMSPEQARSRKVDKRTDIWAFGCVLYEALTGQQAYKGETISDCIAAILKSEPDWKTLPDTTPLMIRDLLRRCLQKDSRKRLHDIADVRIEVEEALAELSKSATDAISTPAKKRAITFLRAAFIGLIVGAAAASFVLWKLTPSTQLPRLGVTRFLINLPGTTALADTAPCLALSPDGRQLVYLATSGDKRQLYLQSLDQIEATPILGTEDAHDPFFSPDSQWVGFFTGRKLKKVSLVGEGSVTLCDVEGGNGASWKSDDTIIFTTTEIRTLMSISASGGTPEMVTRMSSEQGSLHYSSPEVLPGGEAVLFTIITGTGFENQSIAVYSMDSAKQRVLIEEGSQARYASTGHLIYARGDSLMAVPFDVDRLEVTDLPASVVQDVSSDPLGNVSFSLSNEGSLIYVPAKGILEHTVLWMDRQGNAQPIQLPPHYYFAPSLSPDGRHLAMTTLDGPSMETWVYEIERGTLTRFTFEGSNHFSVWTPDGNRLAFSSDREGIHNLFWKPADGSGVAERLATSDQHQDIGSWSPEGKILTFVENHPKTNCDIWLLHIEGERLVKPFLQTGFDEDHPMISPNGQWLAYRSNESGSDEIYVQPFPNGGRKWQISTEGGSAPIWAQNGRELFYRDGRKLMVVEVKTESVFAAGRPRLLFESDTDVSAGYGRPCFDITPDGRRFVMTKIKPQPPPTQIHVVLNWFEELKRLVSSEK